MHLPDGILSLPVVTTTWMLTAGGVWIGLRSLKDGDIPKAGVLASVFFVIGLIAIPVPPGSVHLLLNGLMGIVLGWTAFPAILLAIMLQTIQFGHGGYATIGANTLVMALPAVGVGYAFRFAVARLKISRFALIAFGASALAVMLACILQATLLYLSDKAFLLLASALLLSHLPVMILDGVVSASAIAFLHRVRPEVLPSVINMREGVSP